MRFFGLLGFPLGHSFSVSYFKNKFERENILGCVYEAFPLDKINRMPELIQSKEDWAGFNVTIPYKETIIGYLDELDETARYIGAVNTIRIRNNRLKGYNTDWIGFKNSLVPLLRKPPYKALVLGTGGSSKAVAYVLKGLNIPFRFISRNASSDSILYKAIDQEVLDEYKLIINCTPLGMFPQTNSYPEIPYEFLNGDHILFDLIYNPVETEFLKKGKDRGATIQNGLEMLHLQAEAAWTIWNENDGVYEKS